MEIKKIGNDLHILDLKCLNVGLTLDCGQAFRWVKEDDNTFVGVASDKYLKIIQNENEIIFKNTTIEDFNNFWYNYFDMDRDYEYICKKLKEDSLISSTIDEYYGIRILNQDPWEALCSFVISQQNNIKRIKLIIDRLCKKYGKYITEGEYSFPSAKVLAKLDVKDFEELGLGYRAKYVEKLAKDVANGTVDLDKIKNSTMEDAQKQLLEIYGVGIKVASCAMLFGFGFVRAFPVDVWMKRVMEHYPDGLPKCFENYEGIAQQYLFHWARNNL